MAFVETTQTIGAIPLHTVLQVVGHLNSDVVVNLHSYVCFSLLSSSSDGSYSESKLQYHFQIFARN